MKTRILKIAYFLILLADILIRLFSLNELDKFIKPLLMPMLLYYLIERTQGKIYKTHLYLAAALIFAWIGDIMLLNSEKIFFLSGILSFLITQLIYFYLFRQNIKDRLFDAIRKNIVVSGVFLSLYLVAIYCILLLVEGNLKYAIVIYASMVTATTIASFYQYRQLTGYFLICIGMTLFFVSDGMIATDMFVQRIIAAPAWIMITYGLAQFMITEGIIRSVEKQ